MTYLASPYSHPGSKIVDDRYFATLAHVARRARENKQVISPIVHWHVAAITHNLPGDAQFWLDWNMKMLKLCDSLEVLCLPGWEESKGVQLEIQLALRLGLPIRYTSP